MKILHIITGLNIGGAEGVLYRLIRNSSKHRHFVISLKDKGFFGEKFDFEGTLLYTLNMPSGWISIKGLRKLYMLIRSIKPDVIQTWMYHGDFLGGLMAKIAGCNKIVWSVRHSTLIVGHISMSTRIIGKSCALSSDWIPKRIVFNSNKSIQLHIAKGYSQKKVVLIPNGFNCEKFRPNKLEREKLRKELGVKQHEVILGMVARWEPVKDYTNFFSAINILNSTINCLFKVVLIGSGITDYNLNLIKLCNLYSVINKVHLLGPRDDISSLMNAMDICVLSSFSESFPNVIAEAMACGVPVVTTDVGDSALIVNNLGWVVKPSDSSSLANAISLAIAEKINEPKAWEARKIACRNHIIDNYSLERMVSSFERVWHEVAHET